MAEDLTATTFQRALEAIRYRNFRNDAFGGWLYRVASNAIVDHVRQGRRTVAFGGTGEDGLGDDREALLGDDAATAAFAAALDRDVVRRALVRLPEAQRRLLVLKFFDGLELDELCTAFGCSRPTFAVKLHRALVALRAAIAQETTDAA